MQLNKYSFSFKNDLPNEILFDKNENNLKKINPLKIELQEPKEERMHLLSPNKSNKKILEEDIYKTEMNNKKPIEIFQDITIDNQENSQTEETKQNTNLQYLTKLYLSE